MGWKWDGWDGNSSRFQKPLPFSSLLCNLIRSRNIVFLPCGGQTALYARVSMETWCHYVKGSVVRTHSKFLVRWLKTVWEVDFYSSLAPLGLMDERFCSSNKSINRFSQGWSKEHLCRFWSQLSKSSQRYKRTLFPVKSINAGGKRILYNVKLV